MEIEDLKKDKENVKNKQQKKLKIVLVIIGVVLIFSALRSVYYTYKEDKSYELKGWQTATATCTQENSYTRTTTRERWYKTYPILSKKIPLCSIWSRVYT